MKTLRCSSPRFHLHRRNIKVMAASRPLTAEDNYANLCSNMTALAGGCSSPVSGYAGRWSRYQGGNVDHLLAGGDIIYGFKRKDGHPDVTQVWKAEEGDLNSPKLQSQRATLPQLQKDPLQLQLDMDTLVIEVAADSPLLQPSFQGVPTNQLSSTLGTLAVPRTGNLVVTGALPDISGSAAATAATDGLQQRQADKGHPEAAKSWFNRLYLRAPLTTSGSSSGRWSVMLHYDTSTGDLLTHYHTWEVGLSPEPASLVEVFTPGAHQQLLDNERLKHNAVTRPGSIDEYLDTIRPQATYCCSLLQYKDDGSSCTYSHTTAAADSTHASNMMALSGGPEPLEVWYDSGCYFRAPSSLHPDVVSGGDIVLEVGALLPDDQHHSGEGQQTPQANVVLESSTAAGGVIRWLVCYKGAAERRLQWALNEMFTV